NKPGASEQPGPTGEDAQRRIPGRALSCHARWFDEAGDILLVRVLPLRCGVRTSLERESRVLPHNRRARHTEGARLRWTASRSRGHLRHRAQVRIEIDRRRYPDSANDANVGPRAVVWRERDRRGTGAAQRAVYPVQLSGAAWRRLYDSNTGLRVAACQGAVDPVPARWRRVLCMAVPVAAGPQASLNLFLLLYRCFGHAPGLRPPPASRLPVARARGGGASYR